MSCRLIAFTASGDEIHGTPCFSCVKPAVFAGYRYIEDRPGTSFLVVEAEGAPFALFWNGRPHDLNNPRYPWIIRKELRRRFGY
jgi:hypothetical protein